MESQVAAAGLYDGKPEAEEFGVRVTISSVILSERTVGSFDAADLRGDVTVVTVKERTHETSVTGVSAVTYSFQRKPAGNISLPTMWSVLAWSLLAALSGALFVSLLIAGMMNKDLDLGLPVVYYYLTLALIFFASSSMRTRGFNQFFTLNAAKSVLEEAEKIYGSIPLIDLPVGRVSESRAKLEELLGNLSPSKIAARSTALTASAKRTRTESY